jgi:hypothetical protein
MQTLAFLWFELQDAQQCLRETFAESQVPAKAGMALSLFQRKRIYEPIKNALWRRLSQWALCSLRRPATVMISLRKDMPW